MLLFSGKIPQCFSLPSYVLKQIHVGFLVISHLLTFGRVHGDTSSPSFVINVFMVWVLLPSWSIFMWEFRKILKTKLPSSQNLSKALEYILKINFAYFCIFSDSQNYLHSCFNFPNDEWLNDEHILIFMNEANYLNEDFFFFPKENIFPNRSTTVNTDTARYFKCWGNTAVICQDTMLITVKWLRPNYSTELFSYFFWPRGTVKTLSRH